MFLNLLLQRKQKIKVNVKLLAGLDQISGYNPKTGITLEVANGTPLRKAVKSIPLPSDQPVSYMVNGNKVSDNVPLKEGDEIFCFLPFAGG